MIDRIIDFSARNRFLAILSLVAIAVVAFWCLERVPLDAIPDLSDTQVIVYSRWDRSPDIVEDQVTYPIITSLLGAPKVKDNENKCQKKGAGYCRGSAGVCTSG